MEIKVFTCNPWQENTIVLHDETGEAAVIDCGCYSDGERQALRSFLAGHGLTPVLLLNTHLHVDHVFGNGFMLEEYGLRARAHRADEFLLSEIVTHAARWGTRGIEPPPAPGSYLDEGETARFGKTELIPIHVPGHSPGSLCYYIEREQLLLSGDVLFAGNIGRADLPGGDPEQLVTGIREKLLAPLPGETRVLPGHGGMTTIGRERRTNPYLVS
jgi:glyoxylase-like metal-dependent hydrolase (beta-lactamase superfamily II)